MFSFLNISALLGLLGVGIPILIHFFARQKLIKIPFSSTVFLKQIQKQRMRRVQLRQWLLLVLRCLIILTFVLAFAQPTIRVASGVGRHAARSSAILLLDNSMSMGRKGLFEIALKNLNSTLDIFTQEDEVKIDHVVQTQSQAPRYFNERLLSTFGNTVSLQRGDLHESLFDAVSEIKRSTNLNQEIFIFSDFQTTAFPALEDSSQTLDWEGRIFLLPESSETENLGIVDGGVEDAILRFNEPLNVFAKIKNFGKRRVQNRLVRLFNQNRPVAQRMVDLEAGETDRIVFQITPEQRGWIWGSIQVEEDALLQDNAWYLAEKIPDRLHILLVGNSQSDFHFLELAVKPQKNPNTLFDIQTSLLTDSWADGLNQKDVIFFVNVPALTDHQVIRTKQYLKNGGGLFLIPGQALDLRNMNTQFLQPVLSMNWVWIRGGREDSNAYLSLGQVDYNHPVFDGVFEKGKTTFHSPQFYRVIESVGDFITILSLTNGQPLLIEKSLKDGNVFILNSSLDPRWSNLAYSTFFSPLILRSIFYLASPRQQTKKITHVGDPVFCMTETDDVSASYHVLTPEGEEILLLPKIRQGELVLQLDQSKAPGIYRFFQEDQFLGMSSVNTDSLESDLEMIQPKEIKKYFPNAYLKNVENADQIKKVVSETRFGREIQKEVFLLCFLLLITEMLVARSGKINIPKRQSHTHSKKAL